MSCNINIIGYSSQLTFISKQYVLWLEGIPRTIILFEFPNYLTNVLNFNGISDATWSLVIFMCVKLCVTIFAKRCHVPTQIQCSLATNTQLDTAVD